MAKPSMGCVVYIFTIGINSQSFPGLYSLYMDSTPSQKKRSYNVHTTRLYGMLHNAERCK